MEKRLLYTHVKQATLIFFFFNKKLELEGTKIIGDFEGYYGNVRKITI